MIVIIIIAIVITSAVPVLTIKYSEHYSDYNQQ